MTIKNLKNLRYIPQQIELYEKRLEELRTENDNSPSYTDLIKTYEGKMQEYKAQFIEGERFIADIEDSYLQQALFLRFIKGEKWQKIVVLLGGGNTADGVRKACCRYIRDEGKYFGVYLVFILVLWCLYTVKRCERYNVKKRLFTTVCAPS